MTQVNANTIGELFQELTKYQYFTTPSDMVRGRATPAVQKALPPGSQPITLPKMPPAADQATDFWGLVESRRSRRNFSRSPLSLDELAMLLWGTQGVQKVVDGHAIRTVPSAGARHPLETYLVINRVESLPGGLYRYQPVEHQLVMLREDSDIGQDVAEACLEQSMVALSAVTFVWSAVIDRARWKYQQRGYRYIYLDAGHVCQNLYLTCEAMGLGCCAIGAFEDDRMNRLVDVDGKEEFVIYSAAVGKRRGNA